MPPRSLPWNGIATGYFCLVIALLTLNPFRFQAYDSSQYWLWNFRPSDVLQNILLFVPLGVLLGHGFRLTPRVCLVLGLLLSGVVESTQLLIVERTSNVLDLLPNGAGAYLGSRCWDGLRLQPQGQAGWLGDSCGNWQGHCPNPQIPLAMMILPLCWIRAILAEGQPNSEWLILPNAIAGLTLLKSSQIPGQHHHWVTPYLWLLLAIIPIARQGGGLCLAIACTAMVIEHFASKSRLPAQHLVLCLLGLGLGISLYVDGLWLQWLAEVAAGEAWYKLRWIEILLSTGVAVSAWLGRPGRDRQATQSQ
jgi:VanZ family protein